MDLDEFKQAMTHKLGPLPVWAWGTIAGGGVAFIMRRNGGGGSSKDPNANGPLVPGAQGDVTATLPNAGGLSGGGGGGGLNDGYGTMLPATDPAAAFDWQSLLDLLSTPVDPVYKTAQTATPTQQNPASYAAMPIQPGSGIAGSDPQLGLFEPGGRYFVPHALGPTPAQVARALQSRQASAPVIYTSSNDTPTLGTPSGPAQGDPSVPGDTSGVVIAGQQYNPMEVAHAFH